MSLEHRSGDLLTQAFRRFERAATHLGERHDALRSEVERLERQLIDAHRRLEAVLDALDTGVAVVSRDGLLLRANRAFQRMGLGEQGSRLCASDLGDLASAGSARGGAARIRQTIAAGERDLAANMIPVGDEDGTRVLTVKDVTEIRRQEEEGGRRHRLEALGRMGAELAHEVRNPLGSIRLFASMLRDELRGTEGLVEMAEQILAATSGLEATVSNLLAFASPARGERRILDLAALAADACALLAPACALRDVRLEGPERDSECSLEADPEGMRQVVLNLVGNALAATEAKGVIRVRTTREDGRAVLLVEDSGKGIAATDLPRVFDPFFSRTEGGTGLGLSIVHGIVERHGGRITLDSRPGRGTRARLEIPTPDPEHESD